MVNGKASRGVVIIDHLEQFSTQGIDSPPTSVQPGACLLLHVYEAVIWEPRAFGNGVQSTRANLKVTF